MSDLPGAVGVSDLRVYQGSGSPHMHLCCSESYVVIAGSGMVQTLTLNGYLETPLRPGAVVWFPPGTIHRLINQDSLRITVLMQNSGLPEAGDAVMTFPPQIVADPTAYSAAATLPLDPDPATGQKQADFDTWRDLDHGGPAARSETGQPLESALRRRDLAVAGFEVLRDSALDGDFEPLREFHRAAVRLVQPQLGVWRERWAGGALRAAQMTGEQLDALERGEAPHLSNADVQRLDEPTERGRRGMCGLLNTYVTSR